MSRRLTRWLAVAASTTVGLAFTGLTAATAADSPSGVDLGAAFSRPLGGDAAVAAAGEHFADVARLNKTDIDTLRERLHNDATLRVDRTGMVSVVEPTPSQKAPTGRATAPEKGPYPYAQTFRLHSKPGSSKVIYLDFDGTVISGTTWNNYYGLPAGFYGGYSLDGDPAFSTTEMDAIQGIYQRVAEDYAPFDVDVTTEEPAASLIDRDSSTDQNYGTRALVSNDTTLSDYTCSSSCGGIAYVGVFDNIGNHEYYQPALIFAHLLSNKEKSIAEAVSHEVGHNVGLYHDGLTDGTTYYAGHDDWAPIMGVGYYRPLVQWSKGEYSGANNTEDDFAVIQSNGLSYRADDHGDTISTATALGTSSPATASGVITTRYDKDVFKVVTQCTATLSAGATPAPRSPDLDIQLRVLNSAGGQLALSDPASYTSTYDVAGGLAASASVTVAAGTYYLEVDGVGKGSGSTGYTDYASVGQYSVTASGCLGNPVGTAYGKISAGSFHTCAVTTTGGVKCWGDNTFGQLGNGTFVASRTPVQVTGLTSGVQAVWTGRDHTCVMTTGGAVKCWGNNTKGQLGDGTKINRPTPVQVVGLTSAAKAITAGGDFSCAVTGARSVKCWGQPYAVTPVVVPGISGAVQITAGENHACAVTTAHAAKCWGTNTNGQLGDGTTVTRAAAVQVKGMASGVSAIWAGRFHTCAYSTAGRAMCWGANGNHQLGDATTTTRLTPVQVYGLTAGVIGLRGGYSYTCAVKSTRQMLCWGRGADGELGNGTVNEAAVPTAVSGFVSDTGMIATGYWHACALRQSDGSAYCWGSNSRGQLGDGTNTTRLLPTRVSG